MKKGETRGREGLPAFNAAAFSRRRLLRVGGLGMLGLSLPRVLMGEAASKERKPKVRAKSVIFLFQFGGPSQIDMFDRKPDAPEGVRSKLKGIPTNIPGLHLCEGLERVAKVMDKVTIIRSVHHTMTHHNSAAYYALSGCEPPSNDQRLRDSLDLFPAYGSVVDKLAPVTSAMPTFVAYPHVIADGSVTPGQHASFLGRRHDPFLVLKDPNGPDFRLPELSLPANLPVERLERRRALQSLIDDQSRLLEYSAQARGLDAYYERALAMLDSPRLRQAFDLSREPDLVREAYGRTTYGQGCLLARRLVEAGTKVVTVYFSNSIGGRSDTEGGWDTHGFDNTRMYKIIPKYHLPITDQTLPTLLNDLEDRGLLDSTLVVWFGEFGRTPKINGNISRDHWPQCYSVVLAGGGVKRGFIHGASDKTASYPSEKAVTPEDLSATIYHLLGINPATHVFAPGDRPVPISPGTVVGEVIA